MWPTYSDPAQMAPPKCQLLDYGGILDGPSAPPDAQTCPGGSRTCSGGSRTCPRGSRTCPGRLQDVPRTLEDMPRRLLDTPRRLQDVPRRPQSLEWEMGSDVGWDGMAIRASYLPPAYTACAEMRLPKDVQARRGGLELMMIANDAAAAA